VTVASKHTFLCISSIDSLTIVVSISRIYKKILKIYLKIYISGVDNFQCTETCHEGVGEMHRSWQDA